MTDMRSQPEDQAESLGAHALHALPPDEALAMEAYLAAHPEAQSEIASSEEAVAMLSFLVEPVPPPVHLRTRIMAQVYADAAAELPAASEEYAVPPKPPVPLGIARARQQRRGPWLQGAVAAAFLALVIGFGSWVSVLNGDVQERDRTIASQQQQIALTGASAGVAGARPDVAARGELLRLSNSQTAVLTISGLPPLAQGKVYQVWFITGSTPTGAGLFSPEPDGTWRGVVTGDVTRAQAIAISVEPDGGSMLPTGDIIAKGTL